MKHKEKHGRKVLSFFLSLAMVISMLPQLSLTARAAIEIGNDGYPYGKAMDSSRITLVCDVTGGTSYQWQSADSENGAFEDISGATSATYADFTPVNGKWYRCLVNNETASKAIQAVKSGEDGRTWTKPYNSWYLTNGKVAYMIKDDKFDVVGQYIKGGTTYMLCTSYNRYWQMYAGDSTGAPSKITVSFDDVSAKISVTLADAEGNFSFGCDTQLGTSTTSSAGGTDYSDKAALVAALNDDKSLKHVAMVGAAAVNDDTDPDAPAFVIEPVGNPMFWLGFYYDRGTYAYNTSGNTEQVKQHNSDTTSAVVTRVENTDSGMTMSWKGVSSVQFSFKVGTAKETGAVAGNVNYLDDKIDGLKADTSYTIEVKNEAGETTATYTIVSDGDGSLPLAGTDANGRTYDLAGETIQISETNNPSVQPSTIDITARPDPEDTSQTETGSYVKPEDVSESEVSTTENSITIQPSTDLGKSQKYRLYNADGTEIAGQDWVAPDAEGSVKFTGLAANTEYIVKAIVPATETTPHSLESPGAHIFTRGVIQVTKPTETTVTYDGAAHQYEVSVIPADSVVTYSAQASENYGAVVPSFIDAGEYTVYFRIEKENYTTVYDSFPVTINKATVTVTADPQTKEYGAEDPEFTYAVNGLIGTDGLTGALSREPGDNAGTYAIVQGTLETNSNYTISYVGANLTISKKMLSVTAEAQSKHYGEVDPDLTYIVNGLANGDVANEVFTGGLKRESGDTVGTYAIEQGTLAANNNYTISFTGANLTILKADSEVDAPTANGLTYTGEAQALISAGSTESGTLVYSLDGSNFAESIPTGTNAGTYTVWYMVKGDGNHNDSVATKIDAEISKKVATITAVDSSKTYGDADPELTANVEGTVSGDTLNYTLSRAAGKNVGDYDITITPGENPNYDVNVVGANFKINKKPVKVSNITAADKIYDGTTAVTVDTSNAVFDGIVSGDTLTVSADGVFADANAGDAKTVNISGLTLGGTSVANYKLAEEGQQATTTAKISKRPVTITADDKGSKYGEAVLPLTYQISSGSIVSGDELGISLSTTATSASPVNAYDITIAWNNNSNYDVTLVKGTYTISRVALTVSASGYNGTYDGEEHGITVDVGTSGEVVYYAETALDETNYNVDGSTVKPAYVNAGTYTVYYYVVPTNYDPQPVSGSKTVTITQKPLTITADSASKSYDTTALTKDSYTFDENDLVAGDSIESVTVTGSQTAKGSSENEPSGAVIKKGNTDVTANYNITYVNGTLTVTQATTNGVTVELTGWTYGDSANVPTCTATFGEDTVVYTYSDAVDGTFTATVPSSAGTWYVKAFVEGTEDYVEGEKVESFVIARKALTITAASGSKVYDGNAITNSSYNNTALAAGDEITSITVIGSQLNVGSSTNVPSNVTIKKGTDDVTDNYIITYANGTLTVSKAMTNVVTADITGWTYGDSANAPSSTAAFGADTVVYTYSDKADGTYTEAVPTNAGLWYVKAFVPGTENYAEGSVVKGFTIAKKAATITAVEKSKTYGDEDPELKATIDGTVGSDGLNYTLTRVEGENAGEYAITVTQGENPNYEVTAVNGTFTINRRAVVVSGINANDKDYDEKTDATLDYTYVNFENILDADKGKLTVTAMGAFEDEKIGKGKTVNITGLTLGGDAAPNYVLAAEEQQTKATADICELKADGSEDGTIVTKVKDFEAQVPEVTGLTKELAKTLCTPAELADYEAGEKIELDLEIDKAGDQMTEEIVELVTNALQTQKGVTLNGAKYLDISLFKKVGNNAPIKITNLNGNPITIKMAIPEDMRNTNSGKIRTFYVVRVHDGVAQVLAETTENEISFSSDLFSVYAICYRDVTKPTPSNNATTTPATTVVVAPKTSGESASEKLLILLGSAAAVVALVTGGYTFRRRKEEE